MISKKIKSILGYIIYSLRLHKILLGDRALIVAFHRISDEEGNSSINCGSDKFLEYCEFLKAFFSVIPLSELTLCIQSGRPISRTAVITFDDGYDDGASVAAPILKNLGLPATFFVTTNFIGSNTQAAWDTANNVRSSWMSWADIRRLDALQFEVGGHTANHVDLGKIDISSAQVEISECKTILEHELGKKVAHFAYPFGGHENIRPETRDLVEATGFVSCLSCCGGLVKSGSDLYSLPREPVTSWHESPYQFGFELLFRAGWPTWQRSIRRLTQRTD